MTTTPDDSAWWLVVPVKRLEHAKSRLHPALAGDLRRELARAFALDTLTAVLATPEVERVVLVSSEPTVVDRLAGDSRVRVVPDPGAGLRAAIGAGLGVIDRPVHRGVLLGDLPGLRAGDLSVGLRQAGSVRRAFVPDAEGTGTTLLAAVVGEELAPRFGSGSARAHERVGHVSLDDAPRRLRRDVDAPGDLEEVVRLGVGTHTAHVLAGLATDDVR
ncbi:2-phospho-L-lactate guanylyltransferase [Paraoerskovia marina]|uniref:Phosphoenolpyruvate guanylyltransferase n=1 Tax=Paraoerskovia marina TaxID=545619 RepID=A0A1H1U5N0_9CELL|nr:2-phospho-L-lactate guanylyltransferase [Paraoerskovia marina]SDS67788.1 2-phospho-L-lactate guanylyltransferase [Paraoerskovia marina]